MATAGAVIDVKSLDDFNALVKEATSAAVHMWATWCEPCKYMDTVFHQLASENPKARFLKVEAEEHPEISEQYDVTAVPFFLFFQNSKLVDRLEGANPSQLAHKVAKHIASGLAAANHAPSSAPSASGAAGTPAVLQSVLTGYQEAAALPAPRAAAAGNANGVASRGTMASYGGPLTSDTRQRLELLVKSKPVMVFIKGVPDAPRCGFSSKVVNALREEGVDFGSVDILQDEEVRQGLKELSNWPTFPQLYCKGELVGGCDIILEMHENGELRQLFEDEGVRGGGDTLKQQLQELVTSKKTMLFMKGTPEEPRCGFSKKVVQYLREDALDFGTFDILSDQKVREGLKDFSNWPTYPQLYHNGELVGGCDIISEMHSNGELKEVLGS
eukprot:jgi/Mesen1/4352/ME000022S03637